MNRFLILKVSAEMQTRGSPQRRQRFDRAVFVEECANGSMMKTRVGELQRGHTADHYYGVEVVLAGDPERKTPVLVRPKRVRKVAAVVNADVVPIAEGKRLKEAAKQ